MATFSIEIADSDVNRVIEALCVNYGRQEVVDNAPNPETKPVFANRMVRQFLSEHVKKYELDQLRKTLEDSLSDPTITDPQL
jgi:hypothetical protein